MLQLPMLLGCVSAVHSAAPHTPSANLPLGDVAMNFLPNSNLLCAWPTLWHWCPSTMTGTIRLGAALQLIEALSSGG
jgi:hypothetical protein